MTYFFYFFPSAEQLRPKSGKTMVARLSIDCIIFPSKNKSGQRPYKKAGLGVWPAAGKLFFVLIFLVLFVSRQKGLASAANERCKILCEPYLSSCATQGSISPPCKRRLVPLRRSFTIVQDNKGNDETIAPAPASVIQLNTQAPNGQSHLIY
jgi:hypothetical protein